MCDNLHTVQPYHHSFPKAPYRVTLLWGVNRIPYSNQFDLEMQWDATTPPALANLYWYEAKDDEPATDPTLEFRTTIIECGGVENYLGSKWFSCVSIQFWSCNQLKSPGISWFHIRPGKTANDGVGFYVPPFVDV